MAPQQFGILFSSKNYKYGNQFDGYELAFSGNTVQLIQITLKLILHFLYFRAVSIGQRTN